MSWLRAVERLSRSGPSEVADAHLHLRDLVGLARALTPLCRHEAPCQAAGCPFAGHPHAAELCAIVPRLAALDVAAHPCAEREGPALARTFEHAVLRSVETVRWCRQTAHPGGVCWFVSSHGGDCADLLKLSHRLA